LNQYFNIKSLFHPFQVLYKGREGEILVVRGVCEFAWLLSEIVR